MNSQRFKNFKDSPFYLTCYDILHHKLAITGFICVFTLSLMTIFAPFITSFHPSDQRLWVGPQAPGFTHPDCIFENEFQVNKKPNISKSISNVSKLEIHSEKTITSDYRIVCKSSGKIKSIKCGAKSFSKLEFNKEFKYFRLDKEGKTGNEIKDFHFVKGKKIQEGILQKGEKVLIFRIEKNKINIKSTINMKDQKVLSITCNGKSVESLMIRAEEIKEIKGDGLLRTQCHILGTDESGRDLLSRILYGGRISLLVGIIATGISLLIGVLYGAISGYFGGTTDKIMMGFVDILYGLPFIFLVILLMVTFGTNIILLFIALGAIQWLTMARIVRGQILSLKQMEFVEAAKVSGNSTLRIIILHLIPHTIGPVIVYTSLTVPAVILEESFLAFIGLQVQFFGESLDSWGALIHQGVIARGENGERSWLLLFPSLAMAITLFGLNAFGDGLRDVLDPKGKKRTME